MSDYYCPYCFLPLIIDQVRDTFSCNRLEYHVPIKLQFFTSSKRLYLIKFIISDKLMIYVSMKDKYINYNQPHNEYEVSLREIKNYLTISKLDSSLLYHSPNKMKNKVFKLMAFL